MDLPQATDQLDQIYLKAVERGANEAATYNHEQHIAEGVKYGKEWGTEFGYQRGFIDYLKELMASSGSAVLKNVKIRDTTRQLDEMLQRTNVDALTVEQINEARTLINKKFKILLTLLHVKHHTAPIPEESIDF